MKILCNKKYIELLEYKSKCKKLLDRIYSWGELMDPNMQMELLMILKGDVKNEEFRKSNTTRKI